MIDKPVRPYIDDAPVRCSLRLAVAPVPQQVEPDPTSSSPDVLAALRRQISAIERSAPAFAPVEDGNVRAPVWSTGANALDCAIGPAGLDPHGVHEVRPAFAPTPDPDDEEPGGRRDWAAGWAAAQAFALMLAACRRRALPGPNRPILWCAPPALLREAGWPYAPGLARVGLAPANLLVVAPARTQDALWVLEEALKSEALALVVGLIECVALTPARRLALAAAHHHTPCLLLTDPRRAPTAATATRWSVAPAPSAPHPLVPRAPGLPRLSVTLARNRLAPVASPQPVEIEWCDEAYRFLMAPGLATRPPAAHPRQRRAG